MVRDKLCVYDSTCFSSDVLVCDFITVYALEFFEVNGYFLSVWGTLSVENERNLGIGGHLSVDRLSNGKSRALGQSLSDAHAIGSWR